MADQLIPLDNSPNQNFQISLNVDDAILTLAIALDYNEMAGYWVMRVSDAFGVVILDSVPLITGAWPAANVLAQYGYLRIGSAYVVNAGSAAIDYPDASDMGSDFVLIWSDTAL